MLIFLDLTILHIVFFLVKAFLATGEKNRPPNSNHQAPITKQLPMTKQIIAKIFLSIKRPVFLFSIW